MSRRTLLVGVAIAATLGVIGWQVAKRRATTAKPAGSSTATGVAGSSASNAGSSTTSSTSSTPRPSLDNVRLAEPIPTAPPDPTPPQEGPEAPPEVVASFHAGQAALRKAGGKCTRDIKAAAKGKLVVAVDVMVEKASARSTKVEVLDRAGQDEAFDACIVNELADLQWSVTMPDGKATFEYSFELAELGR